MTVAELIDSLSILREDAQICVLNGDVHNPVVCTRILSMGARLEDGTVVAGMDLDEDGAQHVVILS